MQQIIETRTTARRNTQTSFAMRLFRWVLDADNRYRERRTLGRLGDAQLDDIGRSRADLDQMLKDRSRG